MFIFLNIKQAILITLFSTLVPETFIVFRVDKWLLKDVYKNKFKKTCSMYGTVHVVLWEKTILNVNIYLDYHWESTVTRIYRSMERSRKRTLNKLSSNYRKVFWMHDICASQPACMQMQMQRGMLLVLHRELADTLQSQ